MLVNKKCDMTPYDMARAPRRQSVLLLPVMWAACRAMTLGRQLKIERRGMEGLKPPYLVLSEHQGFTDYFLAPLAVFPRRAAYVSDVEGYAAFGNALYRALGCIPTRRFAGDQRLIKNIRDAAARREIVVIYPEARHSNVGTNSVLSPSTAKLVKLLGIPVVILKAHGSYLTSPIWDEEHRRQAPLSLTMELALTADAITSKTVSELSEFINGQFHYDEYAWQYENKIRIDYPKRAEGLHKVLYKCPCCKTEFELVSERAALSCSHCGKSWHMDEYGRLAAETGETEFPHIPDWYGWQRSEVEREIADCIYTLNIPVRIDALPNEKGFIPLGTGSLTHSADGFCLTIPDACEKLFFPSKTLSSLHTECNYRGRGDAIVLSTKTCCYYLYYDAKKANAVKAMFATERFFIAAKKSL